MITHPSRPRGFTIIELMVVIIVIGFLVGIGGLAWRTSRNNALHEQTKANVTTLKNALEKYYRENGQYPYQGCVGNLNAAQCSDISKLSDPDFRAILPEIPSDGFGRPLGYAAVHGETDRDDGYAIKVQLPNGNFCRTGKSLAAITTNSSVTTCDF